MRTTKVLVRVGAFTATAIGTVAVVAPDSEAGRAARRLGQRLSRDVRYAVGSAPGILYRLAGRHPDPNVSDDILADRIRSSLGPLERRLDVPHVHVMVDDHVAILHGEVETDSDAARLELAVMQLIGVEGVESHLHLGLTRGDTRPSEGALTLALAGPHRTARRRPRTQAPAIPPARCTRCSADSRTGSRPTSETTCSPIFPPTCAP